MGSEMCIRDRLCSPSSTGGLYTYTVSAGHFPSLSCLTLHYQARHQHSPSPLKFLSSMSTLLLMFSDIASSSTVVSETEDRAIDKPRNAGKATWEPQYLGLSCHPRALRERGRPRYKYKDANMEAYQEEGQGEEKEKKCNTKAMEDMYTSTSRNTIA